MKAQGIHSGARLAGAGFSLVEVTLALAVAAIALLPILAMLPVGLNNHQHSGNRTQAAHLVGQIAHSLEQASCVTSTNRLPLYTALPPFNSGPLLIQWSPLSSIGSCQKVGPVYYDENGVVTTVASQYRMVAMIAVTPPGADFEPGQAYVYVAWPGLGAAPTWSAGNLAAYPAAQGHEEVTVALNSGAP